MIALLAAVALAASLAAEYPPASVRAGPLASGWFLIKLDGADAPTRACLGDAQGETMIRLHLEQESYGNAETGVIVRRRTK